MFNYAFSGDNKTRDVMKNAAQKLGFSNWQTFSGHSLRKWFITKMVNDPNVNLRDSMLAARHRSISAHKAYIERNYGWTGF